MTKEKLSPELEQRIHSLASWRTRSNVSVEDYEASLRALVIAAQDEERNTRATDLCSVPCEACGVAMNHYCMSCDTEGLPIEEFKKKDD